MSLSTFYLTFSIFIFNIYNGIAIPHEYCLSALNRSDCGHQSTPVFSYYKPGSRCEIEYWRGCPTSNMFPDEFMCSDLCIGKLGIGREIQSNSIDAATSYEQDVCNEPVDKRDCGSKPTKVFTFEEGICVSVEWRGCRSPNVFATYEECDLSCNAGPFNDWKKQIQDLDKNTIKDLKLILDNVEIPDEVVKERNEYAKMVPKPLHQIEQLSTELAIETTTKEIKGNETTIEADKGNWKTTEAEKGNETTTEAENGNGKTTESETGNETTTEAEKEDAKTTEPEKENETTTEGENRNEKTTEAETGNETTTEAEKRDVKTTEPEKGNGRTTEAAKVKETTINTIVTTEKLPNETKHQDASSAEEVINI